MPTGLTINAADATHASFVLLCAPYDRTASFRKGTSKGPAAIVKSLKYQMETYDRFTDSMPSPQRTVALCELKNLNRCEPAEMVSRVRQKYARLLNTAPFIILLGGEHSVSTGAFQAIAGVRDAREITVCQIDAHLDLRQDDSDYSDTPKGIYAHSTVMRRAHELGFRCVHIGTRAYSKEEMEYARNHHLTVFEWGKGALPARTAIIDAIPTQNVYVTIDVDGIDPAHMPATGTPVQGGLEWYYTIDLLSAIFTNRNVFGADIVEVAPRPYDVVTEYGAAQLCYTMIALKEACTAGGCNPPASRITT
jgi:agmatinase